MFADIHLSDPDRKAIHDLAVDAREVLVTEARDLLEGAYGLKADGALAPLSKLPNLAHDPDGQETHRRLNQFLGDEVKAGLERRETVDKLVKEVAFTHLNRLAAFKMLEARKLIRQTVGKGKESNGFKFYLADHPDEEQRWRSGEAGADTAYRHFLLWQCAQVAREVKVLFDPETLPARLFPRPIALRALLDLLNADALTPAWPAPRPSAGSINTSTSANCRRLLPPLEHKASSLKPPTSHPSRNFLPRAGLCAFWWRTRWGGCGSNCTPTRG